jgi:pyruvate/2-oxoglutarate dehydrogenase complex dihydrolipoamide dehydrogenase (E3) component
MRRGIVIDGAGWWRGQQGAIDPSLAYGRPRPTEEILLASGRKPVVHGLDLEAAGVDDREAGIQVDEFLQTTAANIWAAGDVTGLFPFTHIADHHARIAEYNAISDRAPRTIDEQVIPWATFTDPELARVGLTEQQAIEAGYDFTVATVRMRDMARAITARETEGIVKLVADRTTGLLLGGHMLASRGAEMLGELALAMKMGLPVSSIAQTIHAYPTHSEAVYWAACELSRSDESIAAAAPGIQVAASEDRHT